MTVNFSSMRLVEFKDGARPLKLNWICLPGMLRVVKKVLIILYSLVLFSCRGKPKTSDGILDDSAIDDSAVDVISKSEDTPKFVRSEHVAIGSIEETNEEDLKPLEFLFDENKWSFELTPKLGLLFVVVSSGQALEICKKLESSRHHIQTWRFLGESN